MEMDKKFQPIDLVPETAKDKTFTELLEAGVPHKGGLALLASAEREARLRSSLEAKPAHFPQPTSLKKH